MNGNINTHFRQIGKSRKLFSLSADTLSLRSFSYEYA